jgi:hypothetical protein
MGSGKVGIEYNFTQVEFFRWREISFLSNNLWLCCSDPPLNLNGPVQRRFHCPVHLDSQKSIFSLSTRSRRHRQLQRFKIPLRWLGIINNKHPCAEEMIYYQQNPKCKNKNKISCKHPNGDLDKSYCYWA